MIGPSRRIFLYWILLLIPTLVVGATALVLLRREQTRLAAQSAEAIEARRSATAARVRLTVETIELLVGDVESGLLDTLAAEPAEGLDGFLDRWERENPLVRTAFRGTADGRIVRPDAQTANEEGRAFLRRCAQQFGVPPPWVVTAVAPTPALTDAARKRQQPEPEERKEIAVNVAQAQSARRDVQELVKTPSYSNVAGNTLPVASASPPALAAANASSAADSSLRTSALNEKKVEIYMT